MARKKAAATTEETTEETAAAAVSEETASEETTEETVSEETTEETAEETASEETAEETADETDSEESAESTEQSKSWVYVGPSLPGGKLSQNTLYRGTRAEVMAYIESRASGYSLSMLVVETSELAAARRAIRAKQGAIWQAYQKVLKQMRKK